MKRVILHSDMNACYASIEAKLNPKLKSIAMAVAGSVENRHGIILAKSQEAKIRGVKTAEPIWQAKLKCPELVIVEPNYDQYLYYSRLAREIYYSYTNQVEPFGLDECWLDVTGSIHLFGSGEEIANEIRERIKKTLGLTVSVGVSFNKVFAKLGSDLKKPDATTVISEENFKEKVWPLPVEEMTGVGKATKLKLNSIGIYTLGQLANSSVDFLKSALGIIGEELWNYANGKDYRQVKDFNHRDIIKSIGNSTTCKKDLINNQEVFNVFQSLAFSVSKRLREHFYKAKSIQVYVRNSELQSWEFQTPISMATQSSIIISQKAIELFKKKYSWSLPVRAVGIRAINLEAESTPRQIDFFCDYKKLTKIENVDTTIYKIRKKYGNNSISFASLTRDIKFNQNKTDIVTLPNQLIR